MWEALTFGPRCSPDPVVLVYVDFNYLELFLFLV